jgi:hypothetical protein
VEIHITDGGFEVLTTVVMKSSIFQHKMPYSLSKINQCFGRICQAWNQNEGGSKQRASSSFYLLDFLLTTWHYIPDGTLHIS